MGCLRIGYLLDWRAEAVKIDTWRRCGYGDGFPDAGVPWDYFDINVSWGSSNIARLLIERNPWDYFDIGMPYPTVFHPRSDSDVVEWQSFVQNRNRITLSSFAGATRGPIRNDFRGMLLSHCRNESDACRVVNCAGSCCSNDMSAILEGFLNSDFCLQPRGDSFTCRSIFDCMVVGSIQVELGF
ncbi:hypothetical protein F8388_021937 [Cannabis sativa]|uniref:Exostosin GT47 domain-containing protein n=1 Tax=Cannabis sativa TaxID=3483 RepID=A0A7J6FJZ4_CANSA|nr:hypothetical protein F8388_021937 [Cannabis sativa]KAF4371023.1 hypothetical protein G4B88_031340 [Cannabis sativa]